MKTLKKLLYAALVPAVALTVSCAEDNTDPVGGQDLPGCYGVYFPVQEKTGDMDLDPTEPLEFTYTANRTNTDGDITVPVQIEANTDDMFTISPIEFEDGEDTTTFTVTLSADSELGTKYAFGITITDPKYVSTYAAVSPALSMSVTRVKWIPIGKCDYTEAMLTDFWAFGFNPTHPTYKVPVEVREDTIKDIEKFEAALNGEGSDEDLAGTYRMKNPYQLFACLLKGQDESILDNEEPVYITINMPEYNKGYIENQELGFSVNSGMTSIWSYVSYYTTNDQSGKITDEMYGYIKNGQIIFDANAGLYCPGGDYVGKYYAPETEFCLNIAPALNKYEIALPDPDKGTDGDFDFVAVEQPADMYFWSTALLDYWAQTLEKGTPNVTTDDADKEFEAKYGTLYRLPDCYASGYPIYFCVKDGNIVIPDGFDLQALGVEQLGNKLAIEINAKKSTFDAETCELALVCEFLNEAGKISFGEYTETLSVNAPEIVVDAELNLANDFSYKTLFNDSFVSAFFGESWKTDFQKGTANDSTSGAAFAEKYGEAYCLPNLYAQNYNIYFCAKDGSVKNPSSLASQPTGIEQMGYKVYATILSGTASNFGATLKIQFTNESGDIVFGTFTEKIMTYNWLPVGTGTYTTQQLNQPVEGCSLEQAEGTDIYRLVNFTGAGTNLEFTWNTTTNKCQLNGPINTGYTYQDNPIYVCDAIGFFNDLNGNNYAWSLLEANNFPQPSYDPETTTFTMYTIWYVPALGGGFGWGEETIVLNGAPQMAEWAPIGVGTFVHTAGFYTEDIVEESNLTLMRLGETDKFKIAGLASLFVTDTLNPAMDLEFSWNESTGLVKVPLQDTGLVYKESDGSLTTIYVGDAYAVMVDAFGNDYDEETVYSSYPNAYDNDTQTFTFILGYVDLFGYRYTDQTLNECGFRIDGPAVAAATKTVAPSVPFSSMRTRSFNRVKVQDVKAKSTSVCLNEKSFKKYDIVPKSAYNKQKAAGIANATPVKLSKGNGYAIRKKDLQSL